MNTIIITLHAKPAAIAVNEAAVIAQHVPAAALALVQAKALYALEIQARERPGPYTDSDAENYARHAAAATTTSSTPSAKRHRQASSRVSPWCGYPYPEIRPGGPLAR